MTAKAICKACPVRQECFDWAMERPTQEGIAGGLTAYERLLLRRKRERPSRIEREHGTEKGYHQHRRAKEAACERCKMGHFMFEKGVVLLP